MYHYVNIWHARNLMCDRQVGYDLQVGDCCSRRWFLMAPYDVCSVWRVFCMTCAPYDMCSVWRVLCLTCAPYDVCSIWWVFHMTGALYDGCSIWRVLCVMCAPYERVLCMTDAPYDGCFVWHVLRMTSANPSWFSQDMYAGPLQPWKSEADWRRPRLSLSHLDGPLSLLWVISQYESRCLLLFEPLVSAVQSGFHEGPGAHWEQQRQQDDSRTLCLHSASDGTESLLPYLDRDVFCYDTGRLLAQTEGLTVLSFLSCVVYVPKII